MPELLLLEDELVLGEGVKKHPERFIGAGELQVDDSVETSSSKRRTPEPTKIGKRGHFDSSFLWAMELVMNILKFATQKDV